MSDEQTPTLEEVVQRFLSAEESLRSLKLDRERLADAAQRFQAVSASNEEHALRGREALEEARRNLQLQAESFEVVGRDVDSLLEAMTDTTAEVRQTTEVLRTIDPAAMTRELGDLRRDAADNAAELREVRRSLVRLSEAVDEIRTSVSEISGVQIDIKGSVDALSASHQSLLASQATQLRRLSMTLGVAVATLLAAVVSILV